MKIGDWETHEAADAFPLMEGLEFDALVDDIRKHGQQEPILVIRRKKGDLVIDGRNRLRACLEAGVTPRFQPYRGAKDMLAIIAIVRSKNARRRHLSAARLAFIAGKLINLERAHGAKRRISTQNNDAGRAMAASLDSDVRGKSSEIMAREFGVSKSSVERAAVVDRLGTPELKRAIEEGNVAISTAEELARLPENDQRAVLAEAQGSPRAIRKIMQERQATTPAASTPPAASAPKSEAPDPFCVEVAQLRGSLCSAQERCDVLARLALLDASASSRVEAVRELATTVQRAVDLAKRLESLPDLRLVSEPSTGE